MNTSKSDASLPMGLIVIALLIFFLILLQASYWEARKEQKDALRIWHTRTNGAAIKIGTNK